MELIEILTGCINQNTDFISWCDQMIERYGDDTGCYQGMKSDAIKTNEVLQRDLEKLN